VFFRLNDDNTRFPDPGLAEPAGGLLAVGGDLSPERLLAAYRLGIFPWYEEGDPILWWSPAPRLILEPEKIHLSRRLARSIRQGRLTTALGQDCPKLIGLCRESRIMAGEGTWITPEMVEAYCELHRLGHVHSVECYEGEELVGGLYGVALGGIFCGESMCSLRPDVSKIALIALARFLARHDFSFIDCQMKTAHLARMGAVEISDEEFRRRLKQALEMPGLPGNWQGLTP